LYLFHLILNIFFRKNQDSNFRIWQKQEWRKIRW
jgi:hypothetical protein